MTLINKKRKKVCVITGSRADYGILSYLLKDLQNSNDFDLKLIVTCMHLMPKYGNSYKEIIGDKIKIFKKIKLPLKSDKILDISKATGYGIDLYSKTLKKINPNFVVILGDRFEALSFSIASLFLKIPIVHIHGGESTYSVIDDSIRHSITKMANIHLVSNNFYRNRIIRMGENPQNVFTVGSLALDNLSKMKFYSKQLMEEKLKFKFAKKNILATFHPETLEKDNFLKKVNLVLKNFEKLKNTKIIFTSPNADMGNSIILKRLKEYVKKNKSKCLLVKSLGQKLYFSILKHVNIVVGNSSSGIIEVPSFKIPTIDLGTRQLGRLKPKSVISCDFNSINFKKSLTRSFSLKFKKKIKNIKNPYFKKHTAKNILNILKKLNFRSGNKKIFYDKKIRSL